MIIYVYLLNLWMHYYILWYVYSTDIVIMYHKKFNYLLLYPFQYLCDPNYLLMTNHIKKIFFLNCRLWNTILFLFSPRKKFISNLESSSTCTFYLQHFSPNQVLYKYLDQSLLVFHTIGQNLKFLLDIWISF